MGALNLRYLVSFTNLVRAKSLQLKLTSLNVSFFIPTALFFTRTIKQIVKENSGKFKEVEI